MSSEWQTPAGWYPDPRRRFEHRYWNGSAWTDQVASGGITHSDPVDAPPAPGAFPSAAAYPATGAYPGTAGPARAGYATATNGWPAVRIVAMIGAALLALGSFLPWGEVHVSFLSLSFKGTDGDGKITLALGLVSLVLLAAAGGSTAARWVAVGAAGVGGAVALYDLVDLQQAFSNVPDRADASVGIGLYLCVAGAAIALAGGVMYAVAAGRARA